MCGAMNIEKTARSLVSEFDTNNPFKIAREKNIIVLYEPLGTIRGYYNCTRRQKFIHINQDLNEYQTYFTGAHELGHAILHPKSNTPFLRECTFYSVNRLEKEANQFAAFTLYDDYIFEEYLLCNYTLAQMACALGIPDIELIEYRVRHLKQKGGFL